MRKGVFGESYSLHLHKNLLTREQQSFRIFFPMVMWPINSEIYFLTITRASTLRDVDAVKSKMQLFYLSLHRKNDWKRIQAFFVRRSKISHLLEEYTICKKLEMTFLVRSSGQGVRISANNRALDPGCLLSRQNAKKGSVWLGKAKKN